jgi:formylglycine-generating enzyme required for sulfatase activity/tRNA A-37 threonylcarbamoyl transferase component Bud32
MTDQLPQLNEPRLDLLIAEYLRRLDRGEPVDMDQLLAPHPDLAEAFRQFLADSDLVQHALTAESSAANAAGISTQSRAEAETLPPATAPLPPPADAPLPERLGRYRIIKQLGQGAMGAVYPAEDTELQRKVALKVPKFAQRDEPDLMQRFYREARAAATLHHPNICPVHDIGEHEGTRYITMAYISGPPLSKLVGTERLRSERTIAKLVRKLALALAEAHGKGVVHRDLKPANILLDERNEPVVTDFGLARRVDQSGEARLTQDGTILGTPTYMAPEQVSGRTDQMGPACDVYSLGVILYELLTGQLPYRGEIMAVLGQIIQGKPKRPSELRPDLDPRLEAICLKLMAHAPANRYASAADAATALARWLEQVPAVRGSLTPHTAATVGLPETADEPDSGRPAVAAHGGVGGPAPSAPAGVTGGSAKASLSAAEETPAAAKSGDKAPHSTIQAASKLGHLLPKTLPRRFIAWAIGIVILLALLPLGLWLAGIIVRVKDKQGNVVAEVTVPDGGTGEIVRDGKIVAQEKTLEGKTAKSSPTASASSPTGPAPPLAVAPFDPARAKEHQAAWAKHLGVPVEYENSIGMRLVLIPPGEFMMGDDADNGAKPAHTVRITKAFYLGKYEVTKEEWEKVMGGNPGVYAGGRNPVDMVGWYDSQAFLKKLTEREKETAGVVRGEYCLPTEAQWEYACRAGSTGQWCFGNREPQLGEYAWYKDNWDGKKHPVGQKKANAWGLYDMHGNVWEWCADWFDPGWYKVSPLSDPTGPSSGKSRVDRGGASGGGGPATSCRSACRHNDDPGDPHGGQYPYGGHGFRALLVLADNRREKPQTESGISNRKSQVSDSKSDVHNPKSEILPPPTVAPFDAAKAKEHQAAWAKYLGVPVEFEDSLGMKFAFE